MTLFDVGGVTTLTSPLDIGFCPDSLVVPSVGAVLPEL